MAGDCRARAVQAGGSVSPDWLRGAGLPSSQMAILPMRDSVPVFESGQLGDQCQDDECQQGAEDGGGLAANAGSEADGRGEPDPGYGCEPRDLLSPIALDDAAGTEKADTLPPATRRAAHRECWWNWNLMTRLAWLRVR